MLLVTFYEGDFDLIFYNFLKGPSYHIEFAQKWCGQISVGKDMKISLKFLMGLWSSEATPLNVYQ